MKRLQKKLVVKIKVLVIAKKLLTVLVENTTKALKQTGYDLSTVGRTGTSNACGEITLCSDLVTSLLKQESPSLYRAGASILIKFLIKCLLRMKIFKMEIINQLRAG